LKRERGSGGFPIGVYPVAPIYWPSDTAVLVQGQAQVEENGVKILADAIIPMEKAEETWTVEVRLMVDPRRPTGKP
jgi:hypothetical protein